MCINIVEIEVFFPILKSVENGFPSSLMAKTSPDLWEEDETKQSNCFILIIALISCLIREFFYIYW